MKIKTANTILYCKHWQQTVAYYKTQLGLPVTTANDWFVEFELNPSARLSIADESRASIDSSAGQGLTLTFEVDDIDSTHGELQQAGLNPPPIKDHAWGAKVIHIFDPEGNRLEFWSANIACD